MKSKNWLSMLVEWGTYLLIFLLPWQVRLIWKTGELGGGYWEYGTFSLYGTEIVLLVLVALNLILVLVTKKLSNKATKGLGQRSSTQLLSYLITLLLFVSCLTIFWAKDSGLALYKFITLLEGFMLFWLVITSGTRLRRLAWVIVFSATAQAGIGIWQFLAQEVIENKWLGMAGQEPWNLGVSVVETELRRWLRAYGSLPHPNILGGWLAIGLVLCVGLYENVYRKLNVAWGDAKDTNDQANDTNKYYSVLVLVLWLCYLIMLFGLLATFSRGAWVATTICLLVYLFINLLRRDKIRKIVTMKLLIVGLLIVAVFGFVFREPFMARVTGEGRLEAKSNQERLTGIEEGLAVIKKNWLKGVGVGNYTLYLHENTSRFYPESQIDIGGFNASEGTLEKLREKQVWDYQPVHNLYLLVWSEIGIFGLAFFVAIILLIINYQLSIIKRAKEDGLALNLLLMLLVIIILSFFDHYFWSLYFGIMFWWLVLGLTRLNNAY